MARLFVGNLSFDVTEDELVEAFEQWGATEAAIPTNEYGRKRGFGFVTIEDGQLNGAVESMNGHSLKGRPISVNEARPRNEGGGGGAGGGGRRGGYGGGGGGGGGGGRRRDNDW